MDRRSFVKKGLTGLAGAGIVAATGKRVPAGQSRAAADASPAPFIARTLGKTGIRLPIVSMGVMNSDNPQLIQAALDAGLIHLDTAHGYQRGKNEEIIGGVIKGRPRDSFVIATKVPGMPRDRQTGLFSAETKGEDFLQRFDLSLQRLGLDHVDILYLHNVLRRESVLFEPLMKALETAKKSGKARFIGVSTHGNEHEVIRAAIEGKIHDVVLTSYNFRQTNRAELDAAIVAGVKAGIGFVAMKTLAGGFWDEEKLQPINVKAALKWALQNPHITTAIPGMTAFDQLQMNLEVARDIRLTPAEIKDLRLETTTGGLYCQQCESCRTQCPKQLPIPTLMRGYMYAYGYRNLALAHDVVAEEHFAADACKDCASCAVTCTMRFDIKSRVLAMDGLRRLPGSFWG